jgi:hypothetical protein
MLIRSSTELLFAKLRVYDVDQGAWEQEPNGIDVNSRHVLTHLSKDMIGKDFTNPELVQTAIAPDSVQYALRLRRWASLPPVESSIPPEDSIKAAKQLKERLGKVPLHFALFAEGTAELARNLHDIDHESTRGSALRNRQNSIRKASWLLINSANLQAATFRFDLVDAFDARLASLREKSGIPEPN